MTRPSTDNLTEAQRTALRRLVVDGVLSPGQGEAVEDAFNSAAEPARPTNWLVEVAGYLGGGLLLAGVTLFVGASWQEMTRSQREFTLAGLALALAAAGILVAGGPTRVRSLAGRPVPGHAPAVSPARRRIVGLLFAIASVPAAFAAGVGLADEPHPGFVGAVVGTAVAVAGMIWLPTAFGLVASGLMSIVATTAFADDVLHASDLTEALMVLGLGVIWLVAALVRLLPSRPLGLALGAGLALIGPQYLIFDDELQPLAYTTTFAVAVGAILLYRWQSSTVLLVAGIVGGTVAVPEAVSDWTGQNLGGAGALLLAGGVLVAASAFGLRLRRSAGAGRAQV